MAKRPSALIAPNDRTLGSPSDREVVNLEQYAPAYFTWIANKLANGASKAYRAVFGVGIETWRVLVLLAIEPNMTAQAICKIIGMDKASVSRTLKSMQTSGLVSIGLDARDGRYRVATITRKGRELHDGILSIALERERALLSALDKAERTALLGMLRRLHENLPVVERCTGEFIAANFAPPNRPRKTPATAARKATKAA